MEREQLAKLKQIRTGRSSDGKYIVVEFTTDASTVLRIPLDEADAAMLISHVLSEALKCAEIAGVKTEGLQRVQGAVVPLTGLGIQPGRTPRDAIIAVQVGTVGLGFETNLNHLMHEFRQLERSIVDKAQPKPS